MSATAGWPSWVPDFRRDESLHAALYSIGYCASSISGTETTTSSGADLYSLELPGVVLERITRLTSLESVSIPDLRQLLEGLGVESLRAGPYPAGGNLLDAYCVTFAMGCLRDRIPLWAYPSLRDWRERLAGVDAQGANAASLDNPFEKRLVQKL